MPHPLSKVARLTVQALDGAIGDVADFWVDERQWAVRYLDVNASIWLGRRVLLSPISIRVVDWINRRIDVRLTRDQVRNSPAVTPVDAFTPDLERAYLAYFRYSSYWVGGRTWGFAEVPRNLAAPPRAPHRPEPPYEPRPGVLRSVRAVRGRPLQALDGRAGHVEDLIVSDENWRARYVAIGTRDAPGRHPALVPFEMVSGWQSTTSPLRVDATAEQIRHAPSLRPYDQLDQLTERLVQRHYAPSSSGEAARAAESGSSG